MINETAQRVAKAIKKREGATVYGVAKETGIPRTTLIRKLAGGTDFTVYELARIAIALDVDPNSLLPKEFKTEHRSAA
ncbi:transcriptional regulator with XRE-family HTH domain [Neomicrococcus aestuarii]|uniref:Transcriptional regulator with XRE-family HTH domain n=1 Tax=Neomicrococcus aestuarii TaxID=556325 RepID=A0A7W8WZI7_9MICC|nr:helix-turn-helix transcriptional regulator [Neomicrococcus aestuarii]MBB5513426.1 transcriptional regulator with XRE-family HTH domain [Neomicrococcus aestuarii]